MLSEPDMPRLETRRTRSSDGTLIAYYTTEAPTPDAPVLVLAGGLGGHHRAWSPQIRYLGDRCRFLTWDYRGLFGSSAPLASGPEGYAMDAQLADLRAVLDAEGIEQLCLVGWSMGVQVALEAYRSMPTQVGCLVLINGAAGRPFDTIAGLPGVGRWAGHLLGLTTYGRRALAAAIRTPERRRRLTEALRRLGFVGPSVDSELLERLIGDLADLSLSAYASTVGAIANHDASEILPTVGVPTLVISGDRDPFNPPALAQHMARNLPRSEILMVRGGRHYLCLEYPDLVNLRLERFLRDVGVL